MTFFVQEQLRIISCTISCEKTRARLPGNWSHFKQIKPENYIFFQAKPFKCEFSIDYICWYWIIKIKLCLRSSINLKYVDEIQS